VTPSPSPSPAHPHTDPAPNHPNQQGLLSMSSRERTLAVLLIALILTMAGGAAGYFLVYQPYQAKAGAAARLTRDVQDLEEKFEKVKRDKPRLDVARRQSLPADPYLARREYHEMLSRLLQQARIPLGYRVVEIKPSDAGGAVPLLPGTAKKPAYTKLAFEITFEKADMWAVHDFLVGYYKLDLLQQITAFEVKVEEQAGAGRARNTADRRNLAGKLVTEALLLDGAENRRTLLPVSNAFAGVAGLAGATTVTLVPEMGRGLTPLQLAPVLATKGRDYTFIVQSDIFHGPLPLPSPLKLDKIEDVAVEVDKDIPPVKVPIKGDGKVTIAATTDGKFLPADAVTVDQAARTLTITPPEGETGSSAVTVVVTADTGLETRTTSNVTFKVTVKESTAKKKELPDIADAIRLVITAARSDGTAAAIIRDNYNPHTYEIDVTPSGRVKVTKYWFNGPTKKRDKTYDPNLLDISDEGMSATKRTFKVVAIDDTGLVLQDLKPETHKAPMPKAPGGPPAASGKGPGPGRFPGPPGGGMRDRMGQGPADPLAVALGAPAAAAQPPAPVLYRWTTGKSLNLLTEVPKNEVREILRRAAETGPVGADVVAAGN
jgi:hypothetical protein